MNNIDDDAQLRLERQALTNVRALLDKVEAGERHPSVQSPSQVETPAPTR